MSIVAGAPVFVSGAVRLLVSVEALNMSEAVGNLVRHKRAPLVLTLEDGSVEVRLVPVVSGQSIAHAYQVLLAETAEAMGLPVCPLCRLGVFAKHASLEVIKRLEAMGDASAKKLLEIAEGIRGEARKRSRADPAKIAELVKRFEEGVVGSCVVEDIGGFLYTGEAPVRRTSRVWFSYAVPSAQFVNAAAVETVLHARHDIVPVAAAGEEGEERRAAVQMLYNMEVGAAVYTYSFALDVGGIGLLVDPYTGAATRLDDAPRRVCAAVRALARLVSEGFGAKRSRVLPHTRVESVAVALVRGSRFTLPPAHHEGYVCEAARRLERLSRVLGGVDWRIVVYAAEIRGRSYVDTSCVDGERVVRAETPEEVFEKLLEWLVEAGEASC